MMRRIVLAGAAVVALAALVACGGTKRPPAVATETATAASEPDQRRLDPSAQPLDMGPDVQPFEGEGTRGTDLPTDYAGAYGEQGPLEDVFFAYDSAALSPQAMSTLQVHAQWLAQRPATTVVIEGHCDERGTVEYNLALGDQRARAANDYLVSLGVSPARLATVSYGKERPLDPGSGESAWSRNRRAHFVVSR